MRNSHCRTWNMARKLKKVEKETKTLYDLNMARNTEIGGNQNCTLKNWHIAINLENEKKKKERERKSHRRTWNMARNTEKRGKSEMNTVGPGLWGQN